MFPVNLNALVRLIEDLPDLGLRRGAVGLVRSVWLTSGPCYEVEFEQSSKSPAARALLRANQLEPIESTHVGSEKAAR